MHRTLYHYRTGLLVPAKAIASPSMDCLQDFDGVVLFHLRKFPPRKSQGQPSATSDWSLITSNICNPKKMSWQHESLIHWDDVSRYILIGAQNIAGYGTCLGLGRSKTETRTEPLHETSITVPSTSLNYLGTCQKYHCCAFKRKMSWFFYTLKSLKFCIFWAKRGIMTN